MGSQPKANSLKAEPRHYLAGAAFSNGLVWATTFPLLILRDSITTQILIILHVSFCTLGGILAGYLVASKSSEDHLKVGFTSGLVSIIVYTIVSFAVFGALQSDAWPLAGLILGGIIGGAFRKLKIERHSH